MRYLVKRLVVKNDGFAKSKKSACDRMSVVREKYINKMYAKGWIPYTTASSGNAFFYWENYIRLCKPKNESEKKEAMKKAEENYWKLENGVWKQKTLMVI